MCFSNRPFEHELSVNVFAYGTKLNANDCSKQYLISIEQAHHSFVRTVVKKKDFVLLKIIMDLIQRNESILLIWDASFDLEKSGFDADTLKIKFDATIKFENILRLNLGILYECLFLVYLLFYYKILNTFLNSGLQ